MIFLFVAIAISAVAAITDWRTRQIPNWLTYGSTALAVPSHALLAFRLHATPAQIAEAAGVSLAGAALCGLLPLFFWLKGMCGGGDVKLFAALGALLEPYLGFEAQLYSYYVAAFFVPMLLLYRGTFFRTIRSSLRVAYNGLRPPSKRSEIDPSTLTWLRLGPAVFAGSVLTTILHWSR